MAADLSTETLAWLKYHENENADEAIEYVEDADEREAALTRSKYAAHAAACVRLTAALARGEVAISAVDYHAPGEPRHKFLCVNLLTGYGYHAETPLAAYAAATGGRDA